jgi:pimeloyl-ACP methyl ester carboxylesterase
MVRVESERIPAVRSEAPTLVFLHEGLGSLALWRDFPAQLARRTGLGAFIYSRTGNGFSQPLAHRREPAYMHDEARRVLPQLLAQESIEEVILVGHSDGASIALIYAAEHPGNVRGVVLEAPHVFVEDISVASIAAIREQYETTPLKERVAKYHTDGDATFYGWNDIWLAPEFREWNIEAYLGRVSAPVLAIQGAADEYGTLAQLESIARRAAGPVDRIVLAGCGHAPHRDRPAFVAGAVAEWIGALK